MAPETSTSKPGTPADWQAVSEAAPAVEA